MTKQHPVLCKLNLRHVFLAAALALLSSCINPTAFAPEIKLSVDATITGEVGTYDVTAATLYVVNGSKTADFIFMTIKQPSNKSAADPYATIDNAAKKKMKAKHIQASDIEYEAVVECVDPLQNDGKPFTLTTDILAPTARTPYYIYLYRDKDTGALVLVNPDYPPLPIPDMDDSSDYFINIYNRPNNRPPNNEINVSINVNGANDDELNININEGAVDITLPTSAQTVLGSFIVKNVTKDMNLNSVKFTKGQGANKHVHSIAGGPPARNQQSIVLRNGQWSVDIDYGAPDPASPEIKGKNVQAASDANPSSVYNVLYFYKTNRGTYDVTTTWPPIPNDAAEDTVPQTELCGPNQGILKVVNKSTKWWIEDVIWLTETKPFAVRANQTNYIILPIGAGKMQLMASSDEGWKLSREFTEVIKARETTEVIFDDSFMTGPSIPRGGTMITLINDTSAADVSVTGIILDQAGVTKTITSYDFDPMGELPSRGATGGNNYEAKITLDNDPFITANTRYDARVQLVTMDGSCEVVWRNNLLYQKAVTFRITDHLVEQLREHKGTITITNNSDARVIGLEIYNYAEASAVDVSSVSFVPAGDIVKNANYGRGVYTFYGTTGVPLTAGTRYDVRVLLERDNYTGILLVSGGKEKLLYDATVGITIDQRDTDIVLPPPPMFVPLQSIYNIPSQIVAGNFIDIATPGIIYGARAPTNAAAYHTFPDVVSSAPAKLSVTGSGTASVRIKGEVVGSAVLTISVPGGAAPGTPFVRAFPIEVVNVNTQTFVSVTDIAGPQATMPAGTQTWTPQVYPLNASAASPVQWQILNALSGDSVANGSLTLNRSGAFKVKAVIANAVDTNGDNIGDAPFSKEFTVHVTGGLVKVTLEWTGAQGEFDDKWAVDAIEVVRRPATVSGKTVTNSGLTGVSSNGNLVTGHTGLLWSAHERDQNHHFGTTRPLEFDPKADSWKVLRMASPVPGQGVSYDGFITWHLRESVNVGASHYNNGINNSGDFKKTWPPYTKNGAPKQDHGISYPNRIHPNIEPGDLDSHYPASVVWDSALGQLGTWSGTGFGQAVGRNGDKASFYLKDDGTVFWIRIRMRYADDGVGVWYKAWTLQEWFAIDLRTQSARITDGELKLYTRHPGGPYIRFVR